MNVSAELAVPSLAVGGPQEKPTIPPGQLPSLSCEIPGSADPSSTHERLNPATPAVSVRDDRTRSFIADVRRSKLSKKVSKKGIGKPKELRRAVRAPDQRPLYEARLSRLERLYAETKKRQDRIEEEFSRRIKEIWRNEHD